MGNKSSSNEEGREGGVAGGEEEEYGAGDEEGEMFQDSPGSKRPSYFQMAKDAYDSLVRAIIRPPRCNYEIRHLGPLQFGFCGKVYQRIDFELRNPRGLKIVCSHWEPVGMHRPNPILPAVIYMHGNSSARLEAIQQLAPVVSLGATLVAFDFCGSGKSEGDWVSLGAYEKDDLMVVIEHLRSTGTTSTIALWGRSMGAATSLLHGERDPSIAGMVLDSSFSDLTVLAEEMVERGRRQGFFAPGFVVAMAIRWIRSSVKKQADFDIHDLSPIRHADKCFIPALFVAAEGDEFVPKHHSQEIHKVYAGDKSIIVVEGDHNSIRPQFAYDSITNFLQNVLFIPSEWILEDGFRYSGMPPWSVPTREFAAPQPPTRPARKVFGSGGGGEGGSGVERARALSRDVAPPLPVPAGAEAPARRSLDQMLAQASSSSSSSSSAQLVRESDRDMQANVQEGVLSFLSGGQPVRSKGTPHPKSSNAEPHELETWSCGRCTLTNSRLDEVCVACDGPRV